jgi:hypothetical protein
VHHGEEVILAGTAYGRQRPIQTMRNGNAYVFAQS